MTVCFLYDVDTGVRATSTAACVSLLGRREAQKADEAMADSARDSARDESAAPTVGAADDEPKHHKHHKHRKHKHDRSADRRAFF